jgi:hypothetical protein
MHGLEARVTRNKRTTLSTASGRTARHVTVRRKPSESGQSFGFRRIPKSGGNPDWPARRGTRGGERTARPSRFAGDRESDRPLEYPRPRAALNQE